MVSTDHGRPLSQSGSLLTRRPGVDQLAVAAVITAIGLFALYFSWLSIRRAAVYDAQSHDLANMWQTVWNVAHGQGFSFTHQEWGINTPRLAVHADYLLMAFAPLVRIWPRPELLLVSQAAVAGAGAWFVYRLARRRLGRPTTAVILAISYLFYGPLQTAVTYQFHAITLAPTFILGLVEAVVSGRRVWVFWLWLVLLLITKEQVGFIVGPLSWWLWWRRGRRALAWTSLGLAWVYSAAHFFFIIPSQAPNGQHFVLQFYYGDLGSGLIAQMTSIFNPATWLDRFGPREFASALYLLVPIGFLPLFSPWMVFAFLALVPHWLAQGWTPSSVLYHNHVLAIPFLWLGAMHGWERIQRWWPAMFRHRPPVVTGYLVLWVVVGSTLIGLLPWSRTFDSAYLLRDPELAVVRRKKEEFIRPTDRVAYSRGLALLMKDRQTAWFLPRGAQQADVVALYKPIFSWPRQEELFLDRLRKFLQTSPAYAAVYADEHFQLYRKSPGAWPGDWPVELKPP
ncbi:MAG: DUF2079 domain-containing protein [Candidatus Kerfeldbacteria bacterium]|nr:DUF2079 domain-containing protein [Candidatus Kerfeldbacteria bacterium]